MPKTTTIEPATLFAALSDATRLRLLNLMRGGEICVCDLVDGVEAPQPTVSRHLAVLRRTGLVRARKHGAWMYYSLAESRSTLHERALACLDACSEEHAHFAADERRADRARKARRCD